MVRETVINNYVINGDLKKKLVIQQYKNSKNKVEGDVLSQGTYLTSIEDIFNMANKKLRRAYPQDTITYESNGKNYQINKPTNLKTQNSL